MMRSIVAVGLSCLVLVACSGKKKLPPGIMSRDKMESVVWDLMQADQFLSDFVFNKDTSRNKLDEHLKLYQQVFEIHQISKEEFSRSFDYYRSRPVLMKEVLDSLSTRQLADPIPLIDDGIKVDDSLFKRRKEGPKSLPAQ